MHTPHITVPHINHKLLIVIAGTALVLALVTGGLAVTEAHNKKVAHDTAVASEQRRVAENARNKQVTDLQVQVQSLTEQKQAACTYLHTVSIAKQSRGLVTTPTAVHCP